jgi:hypothetical protein
MRVISASIPIALPLDPSYGWIPHNAGFGFLVNAGAALGQIHF